jgi:hypothetical protein
MTGRLGFVKKTIDEQSLLRSNLINGPCWECSRLVDRDSHAGNGANPQDAPHRREAVSAAVGAVPAGMSGYLAAHLVIALVTGIPPVVPGRPSAGTETTG